MSTIEYIIVISNDGSVEMCSSGGSPENLMTHRDNLKFCYYVYYVTLANPSQFLSLFKGNDRMLSYVKFTFLKIS